MPNITFIRVKRSLFFIVFIMVANSAYTGHNHVRAEKNNFVSVFFGGTNIKGKQNLSYALEYYRTIKFPFGVSIEYESVPKNPEGISEYEFFSLAVIHHPRYFFLAAGPGIRYTKEHSRKLLSRISTGYLFLLPYELELIPNVGLDFIEGQGKELVYGFSLGKHF